MMDNIEDNLRILKRVTKIQEEINDNLYKKQDEELINYVNHLQIDK